VKKPGKGKRPKPRKRPAQPQNAAVRTRAVPGTVSVSAYTAARRKGGGRTAAATAALDDRLSLALLLAPFLIVALSLGGERTVRHFVARAPQFIAAAQPPRPVPPESAPATRPQPVGLQTPVAPPPPLPSLALLDIPPPPLPELGLLELPLPSLPALALLELPPPSLPTLGLLGLPPPSLPSLALLELPPRRLPSLALLELPAPPPLPALALLELPSPPLPSLALLELPPRPLPSLALLQLPRRPLPSLALIPRPFPPAICTAGSDALRARNAPPQQQLVVPPREAVAFGRALSDAARAQLREFVIYNPKYMRITYPMGDVPSLFGVCTDVIVRAYRQLGIDLQALVQQTRSGTGDRNIDHRRVEVIRRFLARHGKALAISEFAEDYQPGDIVTYYRPQNRSSTSHIAIVTDQLAPSGRPMIVHNRGWGPQLEDALFVDKITGHYRFTGLDAEAAGRTPPVHAGLRKEASVLRGPRAQPIR